MKYRLTKSLRSFRFQKVNEIVCFSIAKPFKVNITVSEFNRNPDDQESFPNRQGSRSHFIQSFNRTHTSSFATEFPFSSASHRHLPQLINDTAPAPSHSAVPTFSYLIHLSSPTRIGITIEYILLHHPVS
jgi:hypothetical protein